MTAPLSLGGISFLTQMPILHQLFAVGPGFSPVPAKLVSQIVAGEFVEMNELLNELEPQCGFDGRLVLMSTSKKLKRWVDDITSWLEALLKELLHYPLLILWTHCLFAGHVWLVYNLAFWQTCCCNEPYRLVNH